MIRNDVIHYLEQRFKPNEHLYVIVWSTSRIIQKGKENGVKVTKAEANEIIEDMARQHIADINLRWETISIFLESINRKREQRKAEKRRKERIQID